MKKSPYPRKFYTQVRSEGEDLERAITALCGSTREVDLRLLMDDSKRWGSGPAGSTDISNDHIGWVSEGMPRKVLFNQLARVTKSHLTVVCCESTVIEPRMILEYRLGKLIDEQNNNKE